jgi:fructose 1,6-bisphosphatase
MVRRPLNELFPKAFLGWRLDGPRWIEVGFLNKKPAARLEPARHFADDRTAFGKMMQERANRDEVIRRIGRFVAHDVKSANFEITACNPFHQIGMDVTGDDMPGGSDALREPP